MAHYAELDKENKVLRVTVVGNSDCIKDSVKEASPDLVATIRDVSGKTCSISSKLVEWEDESKGIALCGKLLGGRWVQTSYHGNIRRRYAGIGYTYDEGRDAFITPQPYPSWTLDKVGDWQPPVAMPDDGEYSWDEKAGEWVELIEDIVVVSQ